MTGRGTVTNHKMFGKTDPGSGWIGTTGCKLTVFDKNGKQLGKAYRDYPVCRQVSGHEIDISVMMGSVYDIIGELAEQEQDSALCQLDAQVIGVVPGFPEKSFSIFSPATSNTPLNAAAM